MQTPSSGDRDFDIGRSSLLGSRTKTASTYLERARIAETVETLPQPGADFEDDSWMQTEGCIRDAEGDDAWEVRNSWRSRTRLP